MAEKTTQQKLTEREAKLRKALADIETRRQIATLKAKLKNK
jgi:hypothetical protein